MSQEKNNSAPDEDPNPDQIWSFDPDTSVSPGENFYNYVNNNWLKKNPQPADYARYGSFEILMISNQNKVRAILEDESSSHLLPVHLYQTGMDTETLESQKYLAIDSKLAEINDCENKNELFKYGVINRGRRYLKTIFDIYVEGDKKDSANTIVYMSQGGLGMPDRDYYLEEADQDKKDKLIAYEKFLQEIYKAMNIENAETRAKNVINFETEIAKISMSKVEMRDPIKTYNLIETHDEFTTLAPEFPWNDYFDGLPDGKISIQSPEYIQNLAKLWDSTDIEALKDYFLARIIASASCCMTDEMYNIYFNFYGRILGGQEQPKPRWKRILAHVSDDLGEPLGKAYSELHFTSESKERALSMIEMIRDALKIKIQNVEWMENETKEKALKKLESFRVKIGYPDKWKDFSSLEKTLKEKATFYEKLVEASKFGFDYEMNKAYQPVDKDKWYMNANDVNAYYHPIMNEIVFPAGILQKPFFSNDFTDAENFGGIGGVIAHEMTHGFDDKGRLYNWQGMMGNWWAESDIKDYESRTKILDDQFSGFQLYGVNVKGQLTMGENIADIGGVKLAYAGLLSKITKETGSAENINKAVNRNSSDYKEKYSPAEILFMSWARVWCAHMTKDFTLQRLATDPHSPNLFRVNGILSNIKEFFETYQLDESAPMYPEKMAEIW